MPAGSVQGTLTVRSADPTSISFTASTSSSMGGWSLSVDQASGSVSASSPFTLTVTASTALALSASFTGTVTITPSGYSEIPINVTLTVNGPSGGNTDLTLTSGSTTASNLSLIATYNTGDALPKTIASLPVQSISSQDVYQVVSVTYESGAGWLTVEAFDGSTPQNYFILNPLALDISSAVTALADGIHQATVNLGEPPTAGSVTPVIATVLVTLYKNTASPPVSANPASWALQVGAERSAAKPDVYHHQRPRHDAGNHHRRCELDSGGDIGFGREPPGYRGPDRTDGRDLFREPGRPQQPAGSPLLVPIVMVVSASSAGTGTQVVAPSALSLAYQINGPALFPPTVVIPGTPDQNFFATVDQTWMILDPPAASLPASTLVHINPAGLAAQTAPYSGNITITTDNGLAVIPAKLLVTTSPVIFCNPGSLVFTRTGSGIPSQKVDFSATDGSPLTITPSAPNTPWVHFTMAPNPFTHGQTLTVSVDATGMSTGTFGGAIQVAASGFVNSPLIFPVTLVTGGGNAQGGPLTVSSSALTFNAVVNGSSSTQTLTVDSNTGATNFTAASQMSTGSGWLSISPFRQPDHQTGHHRHGEPGRQSGGDL